MNAGNNIDISGSDGNYTIGVTPTPTFENVTTDTATVKDTLTIGSGGNTVTASGGNLTATGNVTGAAGSFGDGKVTADASGVTVTGADGSSSVKIDGDSVSVADTVTIDKDGADMGGTKVTNMADGSVQAGSTDAVTGNQLYNTGNSLAGILDDGGEFKVDENGTVSGKFTIGGEEQASLQDALDKLASGTGGSVSYTDVKLGDVSITEGGVTIEGDKVFNLGDTVHVTNEGIKLGDTVNITEGGIDMGNTYITNLSPGQISPDSSDAVTGSQLWDAYQRIGMLDGELRERINVVGAHAAALSGLHPIQYNPYEPTTLSAAIGTYRDEYAVAVGVFHYYRENVLFNLGASLCSDGDLMGRMGVSFAVGKSTKRRPELARDMVGMQRQMYVMQAKLERLESENRQSEAAEAKLREENAQNRRIIEQNAATLRKNEEIMKKNAELIRELTKKLEAKK